MLIHILEGFVMVPKQELRAYLSYDVDAVSHETGLFCKSPSLTVQDGLKDADINQILQTFGVTGKLPQNVRSPMYEDFTEITDYRGAIEAIRSAEASFMAMPAQVRNRFANDPQAFLEFCTDPANLEEMRKLGLAVPVPVDPAPVDPPTS